MNFIGQLFASILIKNHTNYLFPAIQVMADKEL